MRYQLSASALLLLLALTSAGAEKVAEEANVNSTMVLSEGASWRVEGAGLESKAFLADTLAYREGLILLHVDHALSSAGWRPKSTDGSIRLSRGMAGIQESVASDRVTARELTKGIVLADSRHLPWSGRVSIRTGRESGMGRGEVRESNEKLGVGLLGSASPFIRELEGHSPYVTIVTLYWPSVERADELIVLQQTTASLGPKYGFPRLLRRVRVSNGTTPAIRVEDLWKGSLLSPWGGRVVDGPIADIERDFDGDGVIDLVVVKSVDGGTEGVGPLEVISGANGQSLGKLDGYEFELGRDASGRALVTVLGGGRSGSYILQKGEGFVSRGPAEAVSPEAKASEGGRQAEEDRFLVPFPPGSAAPRKNVRRLREIGNPIDSASLEKRTEAQGWMVIEVGARAEDR
mgnify:CR=1 FL=1